MERKFSSSSCAICEGSNLASICASCVNYRLNEYNASMKSLKIVRNSLYQKLERKLEAKKKLDEQFEWRMLQNEKIAKLKERLRSLDEKLAQDKAEVAKGKADLKVKSEELDSAFLTLRKIRVELLERFYRNLICTQNLGLMAITSEILHKQSVVIQQISKFFPMRRVVSDGNNKDGLSGSYIQIYNARLPRGLDPHSVPSEELAVSLGYMVQLLDFVIAKLAVPALHKSGFAGSSSRIWQRNSYWDKHPSSQSKEYPLFIPRRNFCSTGGETSWSDRSSSNFGVASVDSERKPYLDSGGSSSFNSSSSPHFGETHKELQKGISLLKKSVACVTAYCYNSLCLDAPPEDSTFDAFAKMMSTLSSSREMRSVFSLKMASSRSDTQGQRLNRSVSNVITPVSGSSLVESTHRVMVPSMHSNLICNSDTSFLYSSEMSDYRKSESLVEGWNFVDHPILPPPTPQSEDVEQWTPATDITKKK